MKKDFLRLSATLCAITLVAALLLAGVNELTKDKIAQSESAATQNAMKNILTDADEFKDINESVTEGMKDGETIGYCVKVAPKGFGGEINMIVGINTDGSVAGIDVLSHSETAGLGAKADTEEFEGRFSGKNTKLNVVKTQTDSPDEVQAITGATITSKAVASGIAQAASELEKVKGGIK